MSLSFTRDDHRVPVVLPCLKSVGCSVHTVSVVGVVYIIAFSHVRSSKSIDYFVRGIVVEVVECSGTIGT